jgi:hypothetical protein
MAKRNLRSSSGTGNSAKKHNNSADHFVIPSLLKTEQIVVEDIIKPEINPPCEDSKSSNIAISSDNILTFTCGVCGASGIHHLGLEGGVPTYFVYVCTEKNTGFLKQKNTKKYKKIQKNTKKYKKIKTVL